MSYLPIIIPILEVQKKKKQKHTVQKNKILRELYEKPPVIDEQLQYTLFSCQTRSIDEAVKDAQWVEEMNEEIDAIEKNQTWDIIAIPTDKTNIVVKCVFETKLNEKGQLKKHKERLGFKGYTQQYGVYYDETFSPIARMDTLRFVLAIATQNQWHVYQMDVKYSFRNGVL